MDLTETAVNRVWTSTVSRIITEESYVARFFDDLRNKLPTTGPVLKREEVAVDFKTRGNASFKSRKYTEALRHYGECVLNAVTPETLSNGHANRSAALFHLQLYEESLRDMELAEAAGYPADRRHKLHVRRARCHVERGRPHQAREALQEYREALDALRLKPADRDKLVLEADALSAEIERMAADPSQQQQEEESHQKPTVATAGGSIAGADRGLQLRQTKEKGRYVVTSRFVKKGSVLFAEEPYVCVLLPDRRLDHCHHCITQTHALIPCPRCRDVGYCSATCRDVAGATYHAFECGQAEFLEQFGIGRAAVRTAATAGWARLARLREQLSLAPDLDLSRSPDRPPGPQVPGMDRTRRLRGTAGESERAAAASALNAAAAVDDEPAPADPAAEPVPARESALPVSARESVQEAAPAPAAAPAAEPVPARERVQESAAGEPAPLDLSISPTRRWTMRPEHGPSTLPRAPTPVEMKVLSAPTEPAQGRRADGSPRRERADGGVRYACAVDDCDCFTPGGDRYLAVFHLVHHLEQCEDQDAYDYSRAAATLATYLAKRTPFFGDEPPSREDLIWLAALLLRHIVQLVVNAHALTKLIRLPTEGSVTELSEERIATAIYPSASYMNHSCDPSIINSFWGKTLIVKNIKTLDRGEEVFHCYGPHVARCDTEERRHELRAQYHFFCKCTACTSPKMAHRLADLDAFRCEKCNKGLMSWRPDRQTFVCRGCKRSSQLAGQQDRVSEVQHHGQSAMQQPSCKWVIERMEALISEATILVADTHQALYALRDGHARACTEIGDPRRGLDSLRQNCASVSERYGADSVELGNLLLTLTDLLKIVLKKARSEEEARQLAGELREASERGLAIFSIHYGEWSEAYRDLQRKLRALPQQQGSRAG